MGRIGGRAGALEARLAVAEARFRALAESAVDAVFTADRRGRITFANGAAHSLFGYAPGLLVGERLTVLMPERYRDQHEAGLALVAATGRTTLDGTVVGLRGLRSDGTEVDVELVVQLWQAGGEASFSAILRDVSGREAAREREEVVEAAVAATAAAADLPGALAALAGALRPVLAVARLAYEPPGGGEAAAWGEAHPAAAARPLWFAVAAGGRPAGRLLLWAGGPLAPGAGQQAAVAAVAGEVGATLAGLHLAERERRVAERERALAAGERR